ncbi:MAG TPA: hypothetical protein VGU23_08700, partial [Acidobacteriaceae bacterium]|nr:hypothetical protein [Acidobacteriaceae bacterium]
MALCLLLNAVGGSPAKAASSAGWVEARSAHFVVVTDGSEKEAFRIACQFERMRVVFRSLLPMPETDSEPPMTVLAVKNKQGMQAIEPRVYLT